MSNDLMTRIRTQLLESAAVKQQTAQLCAQDIARAASVVADTFRRGGKMLLCGNGGSAADSEHIVLEPLALEVMRQEALPIGLAACTIVPAGLGEQVGNLASLSVALNILSNA